MDLGELKKSIAELEVWLHDSGYLDVDEVPVKLVDYENQEGPEGAVQCVEAVLVFSGGAPKTSIFIS